MGPMNAACAFVADLAANATRWSARAKVGAQVYGSLALTGSGHCTDRADAARSRGQPPGHARSGRRSSRRSKRIRASGSAAARRYAREIEFDEPMDLLFHRDQMLPLHPNGLRFTALDAERRSAAPRGVLFDGRRLHRARRRVRPAERRRPAGPSRLRTRSTRRANCCRPAATTASNCTSWCSPTSARSAATQETAAALLGIWSVMHDCIERGIPRHGPAARRAQGAPSRGAPASRAGRVRRAASTRRRWTGSTRSRSR